MTVKKQKSVIVTGGTTRLGKVIAGRLRKDGWRVLTTSHRPDSGADIIADLSKRDAAVDVFRKASSLLDGRSPDALVNNAALFKGRKATMTAVNVNACKELLILLSAWHNGDMGSVVNILDARDRPGTYGATKQEMRAYTFYAADYYQKMLRVNAVSPGPVLLSESVHEKAGECPLGRPTAEDVAEAVSYLLAAKAVTGVDIAVDGGARLATH